MPVIVSQIITAIDSTSEEIIAAALKKLSVSRDNILLSGIYKTSLDARDNTHIKLVSSVWLELYSAAAETVLCGRYSFCSYVEHDHGSFLPQKLGTAALKGRIVIAGFGPAGMFAALTLAEYGYRPLVLERGGEIDERVKAVNDFWKNGVFDERTNVQFGEGGAGTFSDGKLTTRIKNPMCRHILEKFTEFGAPEEILTNAKPHIGTDRLRDIVKAVRNRIIDLGGDVVFHAKLTDFELSPRGAVTAVNVNNKENIPCAALILAVGHSARDTFEMLLKKKIFIEPKPFSIGTRIEHTQLAVNRSLYGEQYDNPMLPKGEYQLAYRRGNRGVYTFCMCPGGMVVPSQSEDKSIVTNGMSEYARDGENANSALVVSVSPEDFGNDALSGVDFARSIEKKAYVLAGSSYAAPACTVGSFLDGGGSLEKANITPTYSLGVTECDFHELFPDFVTDMMSVGLREFAHKMRCFNDRYAVMTAPETRTSSPVRITRGDNLQSVSASGVYPCGEGAGYAGGIMSAAVDGMNTALSIIGKYSAE